MTTLSEQRHPCGFVLAEAEGNLSRDNLAIAAGQSLVPGQVLGRRAVIATATALATAVAGNAGDGALTLDATAPVRSDAEAGLYVIEFLTAGATAEFNLLGPSGRIAGTGAVGTPFAGPLKFAIADDAAKHYAAGDRIQVSVAIGAFEHGAFDPAATDGLQTAVGFALYPCVTPAGAGQGLVAGLTRMAEVIGAMLVWPAGISAVTQAAAVAQLATKHLVVR